MPHCRVQSPDEINVTIDRATLQGVIIPSTILKIVFHHILFFGVFFNAVWALTSGGFRIVFNTLVLLNCRMSCNFVYKTSSSAVAHMLRDAACQLLASIVQNVKCNILLLVTSASDLPLCTIKFCTRRSRPRWL